LQVSAKEVSRRCSPWSVRNRENVLRTDIFNAMKFEQMRSMLTALNKKCGRAHTSLLPGWCTVLLIC
jgi:hypothetical protein